jgi:hypothetical protein
MIRRLAVQTMTELVEERFSDLMHEEMRAVTRSFLGSQDYRDMVQADLMGLLGSGLIESTVRQQIQAEVDRISGERLQLAIVEALYSTQGRQAVWETTSQVLTDFLQSEQTQSRLKLQAREAVEACMHALTSQIIQGFKDRMLQPGLQSSSDGNSHVAEHSIGISPSQSPATAIEESGLPAGSCADRSQPVQ